MNIEDKIINNPRIIPNIVALSFIDSMFGKHLIIIILVHIIGKNEYMLTRINGNIVEMNDTFPTAIFTM